ncbi:uncharacterized protein J3R85_008082 [Psidium guajava]|nr:uncharacterized protein J3R85_008082 [Psidium guajava]
MPHGLYRTPAEASHSLHASWEMLKKEAFDRARVRGKELIAELLAEEKGIPPRIEVDMRDHPHKKIYRKLEDIHAGVEI